MKYLRVTMPDGSDWQIPLELVARPRAEYYANVDSKNGDATYEDAYQRELTADAAELIDWAQNNMNWKDVQPHATLVVTPDTHVDYQDGWVNGEMRVVEA